MPDHKKNPQKGGNNRRRKHPGSWKDNKKNEGKKKPRNNLLWREGEANSKIHPGSYAHPPYREAFQVNDLPRFDDSKPTMKRKVVMFIGYKGTKYCGFQINESQPTIQAELELAMYKAGVLRPDNFGIPHKYGWSTSGRTDKGVHAAAQTISCKLELPAIEVEAGDAKGESCKDGTDTGSTNTASMAKVASNDETKPAKEASPDDAKPGELATHDESNLKKEEQAMNDDDKTSTSKTLAPNALELARERLNQALPDDITVMAIERTTRGFCAKTQRDKVRYCYLLPSFMIAKESTALLNTLVPRTVDNASDERRSLSTEELEAFRLHAKDIRSTPEQRSRLQEALRQFIGTRSFHNFSKGLTHDNDSAKRYIMSFDVHEPVYDTASQMEWIPTAVTGQSFVIHQIRKMIGAAMEIARESAPEDYIQRALHAKTHVPVPTAPATGLFLEQSFYEAYNRRKKVTKGNHESADDTPDLDWEKEGPVLERWKDCVAMIQKHIMMEEKEQGNYWQYLYNQDRVFSKRLKGCKNQSKSPASADLPDSTDSTEPNPISETPNPTANKDTPTE